MLAQFSVENFMSIKDRAVLNLTASKTDSEHASNYVEFEKLRCLRSVVIYGANASGKSNLLKAMTTAILIVRESQAMQIDSQISRIVPFLFDSETPAKPSVFEFVIMINGKRHIYGFSATQRAIIDEYLYVYHSSKPTMIFERSNTNEYKFNKADERAFSEYKAKTTENKLFLATATAWNCEKTKDVYLWFANGIDTYTDDNLNGMYQSLKHLNESDSPELRRFTLQLLSNADINIDSYEIDSKEMDSLPPPFRALMGDVVAQGTAYNVMTGHTFPGGQHYSLDLSQESLGTQNLFCLSPFLFTAFAQGRTLFTDEMSCLHSVLGKYLVSLFLNPEFNRNNAQLIFVTQDTNLLDLKLFRRDQVYFVEKDDLGRSDLYALDNFSVRKSENIRTAYLLGRYGAIPHVGNGETL